MWAAQADFGSIAGWRSIDGDQGKDLLTYELAVHILGEEVEHEGKFENLTK